MGLFKTNYDRPGPGVPKDAPKKKGLSLLWDIYIRVFWELIKLNIVFVLCCIPIVTIGPAFAALTKVMMLMVRERPFFVWGDYWAAFKENWKQGFGAGLLLGGGTAALCVAISFYAAGAREQPVMYAALLLAGVMLLLLWLAGVFLFPLIVTFEFRLMVVIKNAFLLGIVGLRHALPALFFAFLGLVVTVLLFPISVPFLLFFYGSNTAFLFSFAAWPTLEKYVVSGAAQRGEAQTNSRIE